jgi:hypothetical protein
LGVKLREIVTRFFSDLHRTALKQVGFKKEKHRFNREIEGRTEIIDFQGSNWNSKGEAWRFYINVGVGFNGIPTCGKSLWRHAHAVGRIGAIIPNAPTHFDLDEKSYPHLIKAIPVMLDEALDRFPEILPKAYERAQKGLLSLLPVPSTWGNDTQQ